MAKTVTYRDLPHDINPLDFLFDEVRLTVPESRFTPELIVQFYRRMVEQIDMNALHAKGDHNPWGLQSLPAMLRYEPEQYGEQWLRLEAPKEVIEAALPEGTPYQLLYLPLFSFHTPSWKEVEILENQGRHKNERHLGEVSSAALLIGKNGKPYFLSAHYKPVERYYAFSQEPSLREGPYVFKLFHLSIGQWEWQSRFLLDEIKKHGWTDIQGARTRVSCALNGTADILESRVGKMRDVAERLEQMSIYFGR